MWFGLGGGMGWGFAPAGSLEWAKNIRVSAMTATTGVFHLLPEVGYMWSDNFALAVQGRIEFIQQQQTPGGGSQRTGAPTTMALAAFARAIWYTDLSSDGNLQFSYSADVGAGFVRFPVKNTPIKMKAE